jgi:hypothetical protein
MGVNQFTALTETEFAHLYLNPHFQVRRFDEVDETTVGTEIDWVAAGIVSPVKSRGS